MERLIKIIESAWKNRDLLKDAEVIKSIEYVVELLDKGKLRCAEPSDSGWKVNDWVKKAVILYFPIRNMETTEAGILEFHDKIKLKQNYKKVWYSCCSSCCSSLWRLFRTRGCDDALLR